MTTRTHRWCVIVAASTTAVLLDAGVADANQDPLIGKTYAEAAEKISEWSSTPVVNSTVGDALPRDDCIVTSWRKVRKLDASGNERPTEHLLNLNCSQVLATPGHPGNSLATPEGREEARLQKRAEFINTHPAYCEREPEACISFCERNPERCTIDLDALRG
ncbi:hypothetical protein VST63_01700 [Mycolicibacterium sp. 050232]|uniref:hypothetical protein n=1 Tax=Mycolicibacterium sp. 050232 TaxID=3113982 RepID=UPI002E2B7C47|nr:hypothetical protein [Mycolicibacterium sp. 050232]MED5811062.1 hypothetical protein [Mycolicibacterium sp. 050232]